MHHVINNHNDYKQMAKFVEDESEVADGTQAITHILDYGSAVIAVGEYEAKHNITPTTSAKVFRKSFHQSPTQSIFSIFGRMFATA